MNNNLLNTWKNRLKDIPCFVVGNSPSLNKINVNLIKDMFTIGINRAFFKFNPTIIFWQDIELWHSEKHKLKSSKSIRVCSEKGDPMKRFHHFDLIGSKFKISENPSKLHGRGSTGALAVQFAYAIGCKPIYLIGMDCTIEKNMTDFFGNNLTWKPHTVSLCKSGLDWIEKSFPKDEVINVSKYPETVKSIVEKFKSHCKGDDYYKRILLGNN